MLKNLDVVVINHTNFFLRNHQEFLGAIILILVFFLIGNDYLFVEVVQVLSGIIYSNFDRLVTKFLKKVNYFRLLYF